MKSNVNKPLPKGVVEGYCDPNWQPVLDAFVENFHKRHEVGASLTVRHRGETKVDVWGGLADEKTGTPWKSDSISVVFSATKGATALCAHVLASRGELDLNQKVTHYWPEFGQNGKSSATVAMLLNHSAGVPGFIDPVSKGAFKDWGYIIERIEREKAWWEPGTRNGYHLLNIGWTVGEVVRRVSGLSLGQFFRREIGAPRDVDFWIGLPLEQRPRLVNVIPYTPGEFWTYLGDFAQLCIDHPEAAPAKALSNTGGFVDLDPKTGEYGPNSPENLSAEVGGAGGVTNGRGLAMMYDPLATLSGDVVSADQVWRMSQVSMVSSSDPILQIPTRFSLGYMKALDNRYRQDPDFESLLISDRAFGHVGAGGSLGFADPDCNLAFGYTMNRMGPGSMLNPRGQSIVDAVYRLLGYRSNASGMWAK
jgi:CubicO group peptidase (beta-lactamase class C family)